MVTCEQESETVYRLRKVPQQKRDLGGYSLGSLHSVIVHNGHRLWFFSPAKSSTRVYSFEEMEAITIIHKVLKDGGKPPIKVARTANGTALPIFRIDNDEPITDEETPA